MTMNGWFEEQIKQRIKNDQAGLEDSYIRLASVVLNKNATINLIDDLTRSKDAVNDILVYLHRKPVEFSDGVLNIGDQLKTAFEPYGIMTRETTLSGKWYKNAYAPILAFLADGSIPVALIPSGFSGYGYKDPKTGRKVRVNASNAALFEDEAIVCYNPLPLKKLGIRDLLLYVKRCLNYSDIAMIMLAAACVTGIGMIEPEIYSTVTGRVIDTADRSLLFSMITCLICAAFAGQLFEIVRGSVIERMKIRASQTVEAAVMMRVLSMPVGFFRKYSSGELTNRVESVGTLCGMILNNVFSVGITGLMSLVYIYQISEFTPSLTGTALLVIVATALVSIAASVMQIDINRRINLFSAQEDGLKYAMYGGIQKIRLSGAENRFFVRWAKLYAQRASLEYDPVWFVKMHRVIITAISLIGTIVMYYIAAQNNVLPSEYYAFSAAYGRLMAAFGLLAGIASSFSAIRPYLEMVTPILETVPEISEENERYEDIKGSIEFDRVYFRYDESSPYLIEKLSAKIQAGEYVAIVGHTGSGKSTLVRLLLGFEKPGKGAIYIDRHDLAHMDPRAIRRQIGVVMQNGQLFSGDIYSNITISAPYLSEQEAWEAAETAGIADDIRKMPMGMHTHISEGSGGISGGQKQRLLIARAIASKPKILIFDEATSALDNVTQKKVSDALGKLSVTRIVIAHRLSTIRNCDRILVLDDGKIVEEGTYDDLMLQNGVFARLVERQKLM